MLEENQSTSSVTRKRYIKITLLTWFAMIGVDFFIHGGLFASIYTQESTFLLSAMDSFRRIPLGYLALLVSTVFLVWFMSLASVRGWRNGLLIGAIIGVLTGVSLLLGLYSISTASTQFLIGWFIGQVLEMSIAGAIIGQGLIDESLKRLSLVVIVGFILLVIAAVVIQNI